MAGTIALSLTQRLDKYGTPLAGGKLYFYQAGTVATPQNAYQDAALTIVWPNPIVLDAAGGIPSFYLADGSIKVRLVDKNGVEQFTQDNLLVIGPSSGGGGGGGVDATTVFQTGDCLWLDVQGTRTGWVRDNGRTMGSATSGATERANADTSALYAFLWNNFSNTVCPVSTGRGANAAADFAANKTITLPDKRGYISGGLDDMGNSAASRYAGVPVVSGDAITAGSVLGEATHALTLGEGPAHDHGGKTTGSPTVTALATTTDATVGGGGAGSNQNAMRKTENVVSAIAVVGDHVIASSGSGTAHNTVQKTVLGTFYRKL